MASAILGSIIGLIGLIFFGYIATVIIFALILGIKGK